MRHKLSALVLATIPLVTLLSGCGGDENNTSSSSSNRLEVTAIDGYLRNAEIWLDVNGNNEKDIAEPSAISGEHGRAVLDISNVSGDISAYSLMVQTVAGQTIDEDNPDVPLAAGYLMSAPPGYKVITPLTTIVKLKMEEEGKTEAEAIEEVNQSIAQSQIDLSADYVASGNTLLANSARALVNLLPKNITEMEDSQKLEKLVHGAEVLGDEVRRQQSAGQEASLDNLVLSDNDDMPRLISDQDGDGIEDILDAFPDDRLESQDSDNDGIGNNSDEDDDNDGWSDADEVRLKTDALKSDSKPADLDSDHIADSEDDDRDGDNVANEKDLFPDNKAEWLDTDGDGTGDNADTDDDNDSVPDISDIFPYDPKESADTDGDGTGDNADTDDDNDGHLDAEDEFPLDKEKYSSKNDTDGDGVTDDIDAFPLDRFETKDNNKDGWGDFASSDDDGDGTPDSLDATPQGEGSAGVASASVNLAVDGASAHWLNLDQFVYNGADGATRNELWVGKANGELDFSDKSQFDFYALTYRNKVDDGRVPHLTGRDEYSIGLTAEEVKSLLKQRLYAVAVADNGEAVAATKVQTPFLIDSLFTVGDNDADEAKQGAWLEDGKAEFRLWAPTALKVELYLYDENKRPLDNAPLSMTEDAVSGIWSYTGDASLENSFYRYRVQAYHPATDRIEWMMTTDPYSVSLSTASRYSQLVDLNGEASKPEGWDSQTVTPQNKPEDNIIYELHIRDFSGSDTVGTKAYNGGYLAFTEKERDSVKQLQSLRDAGLSTIHLLPSYDISTIPEEAERRLDMTDDAAKLCNADTGIAPNAPLCDIAKTGIISDILNGMDPSSSKAQEVLADVRLRDGFNWGYDPYHYNAPEGSYASESDGLSRIKEYRSMVKSLHDMGFRVVQDVVFNHTSASGLYNNSVLDKVVPGYYYRRNPDNGYVERSTCCDNTASEHRMFEKFVANSLVMWAENYKIDGFRFDLMGHLMKSSMVKAYDAVKAVDEDSWIYGEGWDFGEVYKNARGINSSQWNMAGTGIGTYNDRMRDAVRGDHSDPMNTNPGYANAGYRFSGMEDKMNLIRLGMTGNLQSYLIPLAGNKGALSAGSAYMFGEHGAGYAADPQEAVNYVSKHDNQTLWDIIQYKASDNVSARDRARMQIIGLSTVMLGQGVPFLHMGSELLRSKSMERDSYDSGDWYNRVDFSKQSNNWNVGLPRQDKDGGNWNRIRQVIGNDNTAANAEDIIWTDARFKELLKIRSASELLRLGTSEEIKERLRFHAVWDNAKPGVIVMSIDDGVEAGADLDPNYEALIVAINANRNEQRIAIDNAERMELHPVQVAGHGDFLQYAKVVEGELKIPGMTAAVFVIPQKGNEQGTGMSQPQLYLRQLTDDWATSEPLTYKGSDKYEATLALTKGDSLTFKLASGDWTPAYGASSLTAGEGSIGWNTDSDDNLKITAAATGDYTFALDRAGATLTIQAPESAIPPYGSEQIYLRGSLTDWDEGSQMDFIGEGIYQSSVYLRAGAYNFKLASDDWSKVKLGYDELLQGVGELELLDANNDGQIQISVTQAGFYRFNLDASDTNNPVLTIISETSPDSELLTGDNNSGVMMQYFHWYNSEADNLWDRVADEASNLADKGITALWLPPAYKAMPEDDGSLGVGYATYDLYDLGEFPQKGDGPTRYGDKDQYLAAIDSAHNAGIKIYADVVLNHKFGADRTHDVPAVRVDWNDRYKENGDKTVAAWTEFDFPGRGDTYSDFKWTWYHFDGVDYDNNDKEKSIFRFRSTGKAWDSQVSGENGNYDFLMGADLDMEHPEVVEELKKWGSWYVNFANLDGFRLDAIKHIKQDFFNDWLDSVRRDTDKGLFTVGEYWQYDLGVLQDYLKGTGYRMSLFDAPLHLYFHHASIGNGNYDMGGLLNGTLMGNNPAHAVTLVENHDTQELQSLASPVKDWFKPLAYAFILLREEGYPNIFYADYYGAEYHDKGQTIKMASHKWIIDKLLDARKNYAYGVQRSYMDHRDIVGWTRQGDNAHPEGLAVLISDGPGGNKEMDMGTDNANECFIDVTGHHLTHDRVCTDAEGKGTFKVNGGSVSVWVGDNSESPAGNLDSLYFRGTPNQWGITPMTRVADYTWELEVEFSGEQDDDGEQRFRFTETTGWEKSVSDSNSDGVLEWETENNIFTDIVGRYLIRVNTQSMHYELIEK
ncbi:alpha-amylase [Vibrio sp. JC009]|uniref:alpha-amylase n=1 Tax=Vibrio sp. JC009 TaxID=2912314 RepID=UPI0023B02AD7|nr:alpha-amylase [Vibrio sp. JC009]WED22984.1 alpha-amylase [Vibrio sp. JC009]